MLPFSSHCTRGCARGQVYDSRKCANAVVLISFIESQNPGRPLSTPTILLCSAASKMTASIATYPHEVVRTRLQIQKRFRPELIQDSLTFGTSV